MNDAVSPSIPQCPRCGYDLAGAVSTMCPECGCDPAVEYARRGDPKSVAPIILMLMFGTALWGLGSQAIASITGYYTGSVLPRDPLSLLVHAMFGLTLAAMIGAVVARQRIRRSRKWVYRVLAAYSIGQFALFIVLGAMLL